MPALWRCPQCGHRFTSKNLPHSCGSYRLADHFKGKPSLLRETFRRLVTLARACGPVTVYAQKSRIVLLHRVRFLNVVVRKNFLDAGLWLRRKADHRLLIRTESYGNLGYGLHFRFEKPSDLDGTFSRLLRESYRIHRKPPHT